ncbi:MAG: hypothetical protein MR285_01620 [Peptoniphilus sp.]|uniref:DUF1659 domain-containing protein n=1 Tax=Peptoniphilus sp. TaxID=1971214 RepID=UPI0025F1A7BB|nr:hypothetical protein [Peptoniphilus sp.]MCI5642789.1 hypothetical protein [Peptoniphilus sp.]MDD7352616.1 hypothetical protein [Peptoniphilaceae bacterium]MDY3902762.1 hypothetical protein [Peptoniphilus sp.]
MAVEVSEKKAMLKTVTTSTNADGSMKKRSTTVRNINAEATNEVLYNLSKGIGNLVDGVFASASKVTEEVFNEQA